MSSRAKAIEIAGLSYAYKSNWTTRRFRALQNLTLDIYEGESFGFLGHNGAGKTTTIKCLLGLIRPSAGKIRIFGLDHHETACRRNVGYLPEQPYFYDHLTVTEILGMYAALAGVESSKIRSSVEEALEMVKIAPKAKSPMRSLSKGLTQRVALAQAIVGKPRLLVLDEPFSGLDPIGRKEFRDLLLAMKAANTTIFMSSHILSDVEFLCDRASIMAYGELKGIFDLRTAPELSSGTFEMVLREPGDHDFSAITALADRSEDQHKFLRLVFMEREKATRALRLALDAGAQVDSFQFLHGNLEELFVKLVQFEEARSS